MKSHLNISAVVAASILLLTACGSAGESPASEGTTDLYGHKVEFNPELAKRVPADWKNGVTVPIQVLRPNAFIDDKGATVGLQPDLIKAIATQLGIDITLETTSFDAQVPGVQANRYAFTTATGDLPKRREIMTMVGYTLGGVGYMVKTGSSIDSVEEICGKKIGVAKGTNQEVLSEAFAKECTAKGISGTEVVGFSNTLMTVPLEAERVDVIYDSISSVYYFKENEGDKFAMVGPPRYDGIIAWGTPKGQQEKTDLLRDATQALVDDGTYQAVFKNWGLEELALDKVYVNSEGLDLKKFG